MTALLPPDIAYVENFHRDINSAALKMFADQEASLVDDLEKNRKIIIANINAGPLSPTDKRITIDNLAAQVSRLKAEISTIYESVMSDIWRLNDAIVLPYAQGIYNADTELIKGLANVEQDFTRILRELLSQYDAIEQEYIRQVDEIFPH